MNTQPLIPDPTGANQFKGWITVLSIIINLLFFFFVWLFVSRLFTVGPAGLTYVRPTDTTPWLLLPIFGVSAVFLGSSIVYQFISRKTAETYFGPVVLLNVLQFILSLAVIAFIVNALTCIEPHLFGLLIC